MYSKIKQNLEGYLISDNSKISSSIKNFLVFTAALAYLFFPNQLSSNSNDISQSVYTSTTNKSNNYTTTQEIPEKIQLVYQRLNKYLPTIKQCTNILPSLTELNALSLLAAESDGIHEYENEVNTSNKDAKGLGQIREIAYKEVFENRKSNPYIKTLFRNHFPSFKEAETNPDYNIKISLSYYYLLTNKFDNTTKAINAYNYGEYNLTKLIEKHNEDYLVFLPYQTKDHLRRFNNYRENMRKLPYL